MQGSISRKYLRVSRVDPLNHAYESSKGVQTRNANPSKEYKYAWINRQRSMRSVSY